MRSSEPCIVPILNPPETLYQSLIRSELVCTDGVVEGAPL